MCNWNELTARIDQIWADRDGRGVAVFDADGTLWADDLGERHLEALESLGLLAHAPHHASVLGEYRARCAEDTDAGYAWAVAAMGGLAEEDVIGAARIAWKAHRSLVPPSIHELFRGLEDRGVETWIVSASNRWAIEVAAADLGVGPDRVIAMSMDVRDGVLSGGVHRPLCNGDGKATLIQDRIGVSPLLAMGNSRHDIGMLVLAELAVVIRVAVPEGSVPDACPVLRAMARERGWLERTLMCERSPALR